jgi:ABC-2 type transport system permease protein
MFPLGYWILGSLAIHPAGMPLLIVAILVGSLLGAAIGMTLGTSVPPNRINIMFALILTPLIFTGATQYPWPSLHSLRWFQVITAANPLTYVSEAMRAAMVPDVNHMPTAITVPVMLACTALFIYTGMRGFRRRALD